MNDEETLKNLVLAPYILKATALIGVRRRVGGNQFRHAMATLSILLDYKLFSDPVLLKASVIHDLFEDVASTDVNDLREIDGDSHAVLELVFEVTRSPGQSKLKYLKRLQENGSRNAKLLKVADRISNITDLHPGIFPKSKAKQYLDETENYVLPMAKDVNEDMFCELNDLIQYRRRILEIFPE